MVSCMPLIHSLGLLGVAIFSPEKKVESSLILFLIFVFFFFLVLFLFLFANNSIVLLPMNKMSGKLKRFCLQ